LTTFIAPATVQAYFTLSLKNLYVACHTLFLLPSWLVLIGRLRSGYSTFQTNLLTIPSYVLFIIMNLSLAFTSKRVKERVGLSSLSSWWILIFLIVLITIPDNTNKWAKWAVLSLLQGYPVSPHYSTRHAIAAALYLS
jgi:hypothetical protein